MTTQLKDLKVSMITPYLTENFMDSLGMDNSIREAYVNQYDIDNFNGQSSLQTENRTVHIISPIYRGPGRDFHIPKDEHLIITGGTPHGEMEVDFLRNTGIPIARFSNLYGRKSPYSGRNASEIGYSFDIPKKVRAVKDLLTFDPFLEALLERDADQIRKALEIVNEKLSLPILATPYLEEVMKK